MPDEKQANEVSRSLLIISEKKIFIRSDEKLAFR